MTIAIVLTVLWLTAAHGRTVHDALGRTVLLTGPPQRIVSLAPSLTEILYVLGLEKRIAGVTRFSNYPPAASQKPNVGSYINLNVERIVSLNPDMVIGTADGNRESVVELLEQAGIPVYITNPRDIRTAIGTMVELGNLFGVEQRARNLSRELERRVDKVAEATRGLRRPLVFLQINERPIMTVNRHTFHHDVIRLAGGRNLSADEPVTYPRISVEAVIRREPEVIVISSMERAGEFERVRQGWMKWPTIPAVQNGRIHVINSDLLDRPSPRVVDGLEIMARVLHPGVLRPEEP